MLIFFWLVFPGHVLLSLVLCTLHLSSVLMFVSYNQHEAGLKSSLTLTRVLIGAELFKIFYFYGRPKIYLGKHNRLYSAGWETSRMKTSHQAWNTS